jgi:hypothetical protein
MIIKLKAKILLISESQMEVQGQYDIGDIPNSDKKWVWRKIAVSVEEIFKIIEYNSTKTLVILYDEEKLLVAEPFDELYSRWEEAKRTLDIDLTDTITEEEETTDEDSNEE